MDSKTKQNVGENVMTKSKTLHGKEGSRSGVIWINGEEVRI
jgi:hypothetical protein